jgi:hypothetical protein
MDKPEIWIRETLSKEDKGALTKEEILIQEIKDDTGQIIETWVRWKAVDDFFESGPRSRHCIIDQAMGEVLFGDGINGMIPPIGKDNIKTNYKSGGGVNGNVAKAEINILNKYPQNFCCKCWSCYKPGTCRRRCRYRVDGSGS